MKVRLDPFWLVIAALALLFVCFANALLAQGTGELSCTPPTQNTNGTPISGTLTFRFYRASTPSGPWLDPSPPRSTCDFTYLGLQPGTHYFTATATVNGIESAYATPAFKLIPGSPPNPPSFPAPTTVGGPVWTLAITRNSIVRLEVGSVIAGRACDPTQQFTFEGATHTRVDVALVTPFPGQQIETAWATCR